MNKSFVLVSTLLVAAAATAGTIKTKTGDILNGTITEVKGGKVVISTAFAGDVTVDRAQIEDMKLDSGEWIVRKDPTVKTDKTEGTLATGPDGKESVGNVAVADASTVWKKGGDDPDFPPPKLWAFSASVGVNGHSGNTTDVNLNAYIDAVRTTEKTSLKLYASHNRSRSEHVDTAEQYIAGLDFEHRPLEHHSWYVRDEVQNNKYSNYLAFNTFAAGYGFYAWNTNTDGRNSCLRLRAGIGHQHVSTYEPRPGGVDNDDVTLDMGLLFHYDFECGVKWNTEITYQPQIDDFSDAVIVHETKVQYVFNKIWSLSTEAGVRNEYHSRRPGPYTNTDTAWYVRLSKSW